MQPDVLQCDKRQAMETKVRGESVKEMGICKSKCRCINEEKGQVEFGFMLKVKEDPQ